MSERSIGLPEEPITIKLTPYQAKVLHELIGRKFDDDIYDKALSVQEYSALKAVEQGIIGIR